jgi:hypothetical protein
VPVSAEEEAKLSVFGQLRFVVTRCPHKRERERDCSAAILICTVHVARISNKSCANVSGNIRATDRGKAPLGTINGNKDIITEPLDHFYCVRVHREVLSLSLSLSRSIASRPIASYKNVKQYYLKIDCEFFVQINQNIAERLAITATGPLGASYTIDLNTNSLTICS